MEDTLWGAAQTSQTSQTSHCGRVRFDQQQQSRPALKCDPSDSKRTQISNKLWNFTPSVVGRIQGLVLTSCQPPAH